MPIIVHQSQISTTRTFTIALLSSHLCNVIIHVPSTFKLDDIKKFVISKKGIGIKSQKTMQTS